MVSPDQRPAHRQTPGLPAHLPSPLGEADSPLALVKGTSPHSPGLKCPRALSALGAARAGQGLVLGAGDGGEHNLETGSGHGNNASPACTLQPLPGWRWVGSLLREPELWDGTRKGLTQPRSTFSRRPYQVATLLWQLQQAQGHSPVLLGTFYYSFWYAS